MRLNWQRDEILLVCDLLAQNDWKWIAPADERAVELSELLRAADFYAVVIRDESFRNPAGVSRKAQNLLSEREDYQGAGTHTSRLDAEVLADYLENPSQMHQVAVQIRAAIANNVHPIEPEVELDDDFSVPEGRLLLSQHLRRERSPKLRHAKIASVLQAGNPLSCEACHFNFGETYGARGEGYIEVHHVVPLHAAGEKDTKLADLALLCSNCHRVVHRGMKWLEIHELVDLVSKNS